MVSKNIDWSKGIDNYENIGQQVLFNAIEGNTDLKTFKEVLDRLEIDTEELKTEFETLLKEDEDFKEQWFHKSEKQQEDAFIEWLKECCSDTLRDKAEEKIYNDYQPMMNYGHILETTPSDEDVLKVVLNTNCNVMYNTEEEVYYIVLTGGGMDLSQDIAISYVWLEKWIPKDFVGNVLNQEGFSINKEHFKELQKAIIEQSKNYEDRFKDLRKRWKNE